MGTDITVCHKRAAKSDTKWSCLLFHPCSLHPWPLEPQEPVTMVLQPLSVRPNKLPARRASSAGPSMSPCGTLSTKRGGAGLCDQVREGMHPESPETVPADHETGMPYRVREAVQHHLQECLCPEVQDRIRAIHRV